MAYWRFLPERDPMSEWSRLARELDRSVRGLFGQGTSAWPGVYPPLNLTEDKDNYYVRAEVPGVSGGDLDISVEGEKLILSGERKIPAAEGVSYHRRERTAGTFRRSLNLPGMINPEKVQAELKDGVLKVTLPKAEEAKPRQIKVAGAQGGLR